MSIKNENYITILGFMVNELNLKGNELMIYAIIYGFSQGTNQKFTGSRQYLCDWTNSTKRGIQKTLNSLVDKGLIIKTSFKINNITLCEYHSSDLNLFFNFNNTNAYSNIKTGGEQSSLGVVNKVPQGWGTKFPRGGEQSSLGVVNKVPQGWGTKFPRGGEQSSPNNTSNNSSYNTIAHAGKSVPDWFDKKIVTENATDEEIKALNDKLSG